MDTADLFFFSQRWYRNFIFGDLLADLNEDNLPNSPDVSLLLEEWRLTCTPSLPAGDILLASLHETRWWKTFSVMNCGLG